MKKYLPSCLIIFLLLITSKVISQTDVNGPYFVDTVWNLTGSPYNIVGDVQIPIDVTLTIEPGVEINFNSNYEILIKGNLIAIGNSNLPIRFNGNVSGKSMVIFKDADLTNSQLSFLEFNGPKDALQLAEESEFNQDIIKNSGTLTVSEVSFNNTKIQSHGYDTSATLVVENALLTSTEIIGVYPRSEYIEVKNSDLINSIVNSDSYNYGIKINNCTVENTDFSIGCCGANLEFLNSSITNSSIGEGNGNPKVGPVIITESEIINSPLNLPAARVEVNSSTINYDSPNGLIFGNGIFECSKITGNNAGVAMRITGYDGYNIGNSVLISNAIIKDNSVGVDIENANIVTMSNTNIYNNTTYNIKNAAVENISANNNWWGTANTTQIESLIHDYYDNINLGIIDYSNYRNEPVAISNSCPLLSVENFDNKKSVIYPNPNNGLVNIDFGTTRSDIAIKVFNVNGQIVYKAENISTQLHQFQLNGISGLYIIEISGQTNKEYYKLILK